MMLDNSKVEQTFGEIKKANKESKLRDVMNSLRSIEVSLSDSESSIFNVDDTQLYVSKQGFSTLDEK